MNCEFLIKSALLLAILYGGFALLLSRETFHRFNRLALLSVMVMSLVLPAIQIKAPSQLPLWGSAVNAQESAIELWDSFFETKEDLTPNPSPMDEENSLITENEQIIPFESDNKAKSEKALHQRGSWEGALYLAGLFASIGFFLFQLFRFWRDTKGGTSTRDEEGNTIVIRGGEFAPYSFLHYIIISVSDYERLRKPILAHEQAHIRLGHSWDLLLLEAVKAVQWFNPFVYLLGRDLKAVHEYEADNAVLNQGIDAKTYQLLLVTKAVGNRLQTLGNNLSHHSLKKRIKMMHKKTSNRWMMTKGIVLPALMAFAVVAFAKPKAEEVPATEKENVLPTNDKTPIDPKDALIRISNDGDLFFVNMPVGTQVENKTTGSNESYIVEQPIKCHQFYDSKTATVKLDGEVVDVKSLQEIPCSTLKKVEILSPGRELNLITTPDKGTPSEPITEKADDDKIYNIVDEEASYPGGFEALFKWLNDHLKYPEECKAKNIQGRVTIQLVIKKDGSISYIKALKSPNALLSKEAIRVVKAMPKWSPAKVKGKVVRSYFRLPINFRIPDTEKKVTITGQGKPSGEVTTITGQGKPSGEGPRVIGPTGQVINDDDHIFSEPETSAEFPGGLEAMYKWIKDQLKYPEECKAKNIQGRVTTQFVVDIDGSITDIKVLKSPDDLLSQEAIRIVKAMPKWKPATSDGKNPARSYFRFPLNFRLPPAQTEQNPKN